MKSLAGMYDSLDFPQHLNGEDGRCRLPFDLLKSMPHAGVLGYHDAMTWIYTKEVSDECSTQARTTGKSPIWEKRHLLLKLWTVPDDCFKKQAAAVQAHDIYIK